MPRERKPRRAVNSTGRMSRILPMPHCRYRPPGAPPGQRARSTTAVRASVPSAAEKEWFSRTKPESTAQLERPSHAPRRPIGIAGETNSLLFPVPTFREFDLDRIVFHRKTMGYAASWAELLGAI